MLILYNAKVYTFDSILPFATAIAIEKDHIFAVGKDDALLSLASPSDKKINLSGKAILPGMTDSHIHLLQYALNLDKVNCKTPTKSACLSRIARRVAASPGSCWILGHGWNQNDWGGEYGTVQELDQLTREHPVYLTSKSLHASWVNSAALQLAGIDQNTPDPPGGKIMRDSHGMPTGILFDNAILLIENKVPPLTIDDASKYLCRAIDQLNHLGFTAVHDFDDPICFDALTSIHSQGQLNMRVCKNFPLTKWGKSFDELPKTGEGDDFLRSGALKLFADGALGSQTAAMFRPYCDNDNLGILVNDHDQLFEIGKKAARHGIDLAVHAIGDRANHEVILAYQNLRNYEVTNHFPHRRHRIEHVQLIEPADIEKINKCDLIASVQPIHATSDQKMARLAWGDRTEHAYPLKALFSRGIPVIFGSDAPVENPNPFHAIYSAVTRNSPERKASDAFHPEQAVSRTQAFSALCNHPSYAIYCEDKLGCLKSGFLADLVLLDDDPFAIELDSLYNMKVAATMVNGNWVYQV